MGQLSLPQMSVESTSTQTPFETFTVSVQEKDSGSLDFNSGNDNYYIIIKERCQWTSSFLCSGSNSPSQPFTTGDLIKLTNQGSGLYSTDVTVSEEKDVTIGLFQFEEGLTAAEYYDSITSAHLGSGTLDNLLKIFGTGDVYVSTLTTKLNDYCSITNKKECFLIFNIAWIQ